ncbi:MAG TPA: CHRD domain-containing protein [Candidatus Saccharimonadales bacterium]|nr:CHRD domain-containing protein [Candidatus Saccharimonadales bacterium]
MPKRYQRVALVTLCLAVAACVAAPASADFTVFFPLRASMVVPPSSSGGTGVGRFTWNAAFDSVSYHVEYSGLGSPCTSLDLHSAAPFKSGPVVLHLAESGGTSNSFDNTVAWPATLKGLPHLGCGTQMYLELDTIAYPAGELRGNGFGICDPVKPATWGQVRRLYR